MDIIKSALITIFKEQDPYKILKNHYKYMNYIHGKENNYREINKKTFVNLYQQLEKQYSKDEIENLYDVVNEKTKKELHGFNFEKSVFNLLINYSDEILENHGNNVKCKYKDLLKWRMTTLKLDQDLFICSYLAYKDLLMGKKRRYFDWDTIIKSNNIRLHNMLNKGIAENHFHLKGSAPTFKLSWISLMNDLDCRNTEEVQIDNEENRLEKDLAANINLKDAIVVAALIRVILFKEIKISDYKEKGTDSREENILKQLVDIDMNEISQFISVNSREIQKEIGTLRFIFGTDLEYLNKKTKVDYALTNDVDIEDRTTRLFLGERYFMYECFKKIYEGDESFLRKADLFYAYIIIKNKLRAELIQTNDRVGFSNFADYQERKTKYLRKDTILYDFVEPGAILTSIKNQNVLSIEARVIPAKTALENVNEIRKIDALICNQIYSDKHNKWFNIDNEEDTEAFKSEAFSISKSKILLSNREKKKISNFKNKFFYVFHFPKTKDELESLESEIQLKTKCRHYYNRLDLKEYSEAIHHMREKNQDVAKRVLGIDACSNELHTRPEIYGQTFRFLKSHLPLNDYQRDYKKGKSINLLRATYHVGEDFLDCADGLRAIDEAILYLNLTHGDRLGHAIVLGIDVDEWYRKKNNRVNLSNQDILDNVAWLVYKLKEFTIDNSSEYIDKLTKIYNDYYSQIYIDNNSENEHTNKSVISIDTYMESWKLRGDNPEVYRDGTTKNNSIRYWDRCAIRNIKNDINESVVELYKRYHYDCNAKRKGYKKTVFKIEPYIAKCVKEIQRCMQDEVRKKGIAVECNPSSNVLISNFSRYDKHPILNFYNLGLTIDENKADEYPQMFVSINTDDQGVFDTLIENEFALMGIALEKAKDENGEPLYNQSMIYDWLDRIRKMGLEQSFNIINSLEE